VELTHCFLLFWTYHFPSRFQLHLLLFHDRCLWFPSRRVPLLLQQHSHLAFWANTNLDSFDPNASSVAANDNKPAKKNQRARLLPPRSAPRLTIALEAWLLVQFEIEQHWQHQAAFQFEGWHARQVAGGYQFWLMSPCPDCENSILKVIVLSLSDTGHRCCQLKRLSRGVHQTWTCSPHQNQQQHCYYFATHERNPPSCCYPHLPMPSHKLPSSIDMPYLQTIHYEFHLCQFHG